MTDVTAAPAQETTAAPAAATQSDTTVLTPSAPAADPAPATADAAAQPNTTNQPAEAATKEETVKQEGAPEAYADFSLPEGMALDAEVLGEFTAFAKELNLPQDKAQKIVDFQTKLATKQAEESQAAAMKQGQEWISAVKNDPELGGANYEKSVASAVKVIQAFGDEGLKNLLNDSQLGNHPALFKFCHRISQAISEDRFVLPGSQTNKAPQRDADVLFGDLKLS